MLQLTVDGKLKYKGEGKGVSKKHMEKQYEEVKGQDKVSASKNA